MQLLYSKEFDWHLSLVPGGDTLNSWNSPSDRSVFVIHGGPLDHTCGFFCCLFFKNRLVIFYFIYLFFFGIPPCGILVPQPGIEPMPPAMEVGSLNHWTTREDPTPLFILRRWLRMVAAQAQKTNHGGRELSLWGTMILVHPFNLQEGRRAGDWVQSCGQWFNQSCLYNETSIKLWTLRLGGASWLVNTLMCWEGDVSWFHGKRACRPSQISPYVFFIWLVLGYKGFVSFTIKL